MRLFKVFCFWFDPAPFIEFETSCIAGGFTTTYPPQELSELGLHSRKCHQLTINMSIVLKECSYPSSYGHFWSVLLVMPYFILVVTHFHIR